MNNNNVLIAGCGYIGSALGLALLNRGGLDIWGLRRTPARLPAGIHPIQGQLDACDSLGPWPETLDYLVYCAAPDNHSEQDYHRVYVRGLDHVLQRLVRDRLQPARIFLVSSTSVYHQTDGDWVDETSNTRPLSFAGQTLLKAEALLHSAPFNTTVVRFGGIYGPGRDRLVQRVSAGSGCQASPPVYSNRIHRDDGAGILAHLIARDQQGLPLDSLYLGVDQQPATLHEVLQWLAGQLAIPLDNSLPAPARGNKRCSSARLLASGYRFIYPGYQDGYRALLCDRRRPAR